MSFADLAELVTLRPVTLPLRTEGKVAPFRAGWRQTIALLARELREHGAAHAVMEIDFAPVDLRRDGLPRADRRPRSHGVALSFKAMAVHGKPELRYQATRYLGWQDNVRGVALGLAALRAVDRYGITSSAQQYAGWRQIEAGSGFSPSAKRGRELIEEHGSVKAAERATHPDLGGDGHDFAHVRAAVDEAAQ